MLVKHVVDDAVVTLAGHGDFRALRPKTSKKTLHYTDVQYTGGVCCSMSTARMPARTGRLSTMRHRQR